MHPGVTLLTSKNQDLKRMSIKTLQRVTAFILVSLAALMTVMIMAIASNADTPWQPISQVELDSLSQDVAVDGELALVASGKAGIYTVDISEPGAPVILGSLNTTDALSVDLSGTLGFVADHRSGLLILDLIDPTQPRVRSVIHLSEPVNDVVLHASYCYLAADKAGLIVIDISDLDDPEIVSRLKLDGPAMDLDVQGKVALLAMEHKGLAIVDISDPLQPQLNVVWDDGNSTLRVILNDGYGYIAQGRAGLKILDLSDPTHPETISELQVEDIVMDIAGSGNYLYLALYHSGLGLVQIANIAEPTWLASVATDGYGLALAAKGDTVYLANGPEGLHLARALPIAFIDFVEPDPAVLGELVELKGKGLGCSHVSSYRWFSDIDGHLGDQPILKISNLSLGQHSISFQVADSSGHWSLPATVDLIVTLRPTATIHSIPSWIHENGELTAQGEGSDDGPIAGYEWQLAELGVVCWDSECVIYDLEPGNYTVFFRVQDIAGLWSNPDSRSFHVNRLPTVQILDVDTSLSDGLSATGDPITLYATGTDDGPDSELLFHWSSDIQGYLGAGAYLTITDLESGYHHIYLQGEDGLGGLSDPVSTSVVVSARPLASIDISPPSVVEINSPLEFRGSGIPVQEVIGYTWESDVVGQLSNLPEFSITSLPAGQHNITFNTYSVAGIPSLPVIISIFINEPPMAEILQVDPNPTFAGEPINLVGFGWDGQGTITAHRWQLEDQILGLKPNLTVEFGPGQYELFYQVRDNHGSWSQPISVVIEVFSQLEEQVVHVAPGPAEFEDGSSEYPLTDLGVALQAAQSGWTVIIHGGRYAGAWVIDRPLTLQGLDGATLVATGNSTILTITAPGVNISGLTFEGGDTDHGVEIHLGEGILEDLSFSGLLTGLRNNDVLPSLVRDITFSDNQIGWHIYGVNGTISAQELNFRSNDVGLKVENSPSIDMTIHDSWMEGNHIWAIESEVPLDMRSNWWGDPTGPHDPEENPEGQGDPISPGSIYRPWKSMKSMPAVIISSFVREEIGNGLVKFSWLTDREVTAGLIVTSGGIIKEYPGNGNITCYHEVYVSDLNPSLPFEIQVVGQDETGSTFSGGYKIYQAPSKQESSQPFKDKTLMICLLLFSIILVMVLHKHSNRSSSEEQDGVEMIQMTNEDPRDTNNYTASSSTSRVLPICDIEMQSLMDDNESDSKTRQMPNATAFENVRNVFEDLAAINNAGSDEQTSHCDILNDLMDQSDSEPNVASDMEVNDRSDERAAEPMEGIMTIDEWDEIETGDVTGDRLPDDQDASIDAEELNDENGIETCEIYEPVQESVNESMEEPIDCHIDVEGIEPKIVEVIPIPEPAISPFKGMKNEVSTEQETLKIEIVEESVPDSDEEAPVCIDVHQNVVVDPEVEIRSKNGNDPESSSYKIPDKAYLDFDKADYMIYTNGDYPPLDQGATDFVNGLIQMSEQASIDLPEAAQDQPGTRITKDDRTSQNQDFSTNRFEVEQSAPVPMPDMLDRIKKLGGEMSKLRYQKPLSSPDSKNGLALSLKRTEDEKTLKHHAEKLARGKTQDDVPKRISVVEPEVLKAETRIEDFIPRKIQRSQSITDPENGSTEPTLDKVPSEDPTPSRSHQDVEESQPPSKGESPTESFL